MDHKGHFYLANWQFWWRHILRSKFYLFIRKIYIKAIFKQARDISFWLGSSHGGIVNKNMVVCRRNSYDHYDDSKQDFFENQINICIYPNFSGLV